MICSENKSPVIADKPVQH